jgi:hypothetical protein
MIEWLLDPNNQAFLDQLELQLTILFVILVLIIYLGQFLPKRGKDV